MCKVHCYLSFWHKIQFLSSFMIFRCLQSLRTLSYRVCVSVFYSKTINIHPGYFHRLSLPWALKAVFWLTAQHPSDFIPEPLPADRRQRTPYTLDWHIHTLFVFSLLGMCLLNCTSSLGKKMWVFVSFLYHLVCVLSQMGGFFYSLNPDGMLMSSQSHLAQ